MNHQSERRFTRTLATTAGVSAALFLALLASSRAAAHQIWIEQDAKGAKLYFGEYGANLREVSPGRLDKFTTLAALHLSAKGEHTLAVTTTSNGFALPAKAAKGESLVVQDANYPILDRKDPLKPGKTVRTFWTPAARYISDFRPKAPKLTLDIVPGGAIGELQVIFRGRPLPEAKVDIVAASGWSLTGETDPTGKVRFALPWKSGYLVKVHHVDNTPGKRKAAAGEEAYDAASFSTSLSFVTVTGLAAPPAPASEKPSEMAAAR